MQSKYWNLEFTNGEENIIRISEDGRVIQFSKPSTATVKVTYKDNKSLSDTAEITSEYVPLTSLKPGHQWHNYYSWQECEQRWRQGL